MSDIEKNKEERTSLPGFRFHPTDEELVGFYLRRKVEKKPLSIELIKQVDIYKYDPWDLPKVSAVGDNGGYFFCIRGRKYRNSIRPNRVTGSGFWKATGIDKQVYANHEETNDCIGLKKSLVYYLGSAGKSTKTDWMMHEFRLPPTWKTTDQENTKNVAAEAEVWTLCRIFKRNASYKKYTSDLKQTTSRQSPTEAISKTWSLESDNSDLVIQQKSTRFVDMDHKSSIPQASSVWNPNELFCGDENWDELRPIVELAVDPSSLYHCL